MPEINVILMTAVAALAVALTFSTAYVLGKQANYQTWLHRDQEEVDKTLTYLKDQKGLSGGRAVLAFAQFYAGYRFHDHSPLNVISIAYALIKARKSAVWGLPKPG